MNNEKGTALVYTVMAMLLIFAICALIATTTLSQISYTNSFISESTHTRTCYQIGDLFCGSNGDILHNEAVDSVNSPFAISLRKASFAISLSGENWTVNKNGLSYTLTFTTDANTKTLIISSETNEDFIVSILVTDQTQILMFGKGA